MDIEIRDATPYDADAIARIYREALGYEYMTGDIVRAKLAEMNARGGYMACVALAGGAVAGVISAQRALALEIAGEYVTILGLAVDAGVRRRGVGRALMEHVENAARAAGIKHIMLTSGFARTGAHAFYERLGYCKRSYKLVKGDKY